jgi:hypothetical protein
MLGALFSHVLPPGADDVHRLLRGWFARESTTWRVVVHLLFCQGRAWCRVRRTFYYTGDSFDCAAADLKHCRYVSQVLP